MSKVETKPTGDGRESCWVEIMMIIIIMNYYYYYSQVMDGWAAAG